ncbi:TrbG/VirB9 family P-type conjugative transfer protein [Sodalis glossinidius]|uniref:TrbG/VirB9 family P-type conjugative transfer protein n=1 Tax=Sodalis glossinidius TaxID=63612 RepID=UPI001FB1DAC8|nr:TrbG/VirB9 family P-type conjugative transfer protein [Sodalis glossinidius]
MNSSEDGDEEVESERVFEPQDKDWRTNLFVTTTKHFYSLELLLIDKGQPLSISRYAR